MKNSGKNILLMLLIGITAALAGCGNIGKDEVTDTKYKYSLQDAAAIYEKETENKEVFSVFFDAINGEYQYIFINDSEQFIVNPKSGKVTEEQSTAVAPEQKVSIEEINGLQPVNNALADAKEEVGGFSPRTLSWELVKENGNLYYKIDVKTTTSSKMVNVIAK